MKRRKSHRPLRVESLEARFNLAFVIDLSTGEDDGIFTAGDFSLREEVRLALRPRLTRGEHFPSNNVL